jgi:hypothetical protein
MPAYMDEVLCGVIDCLFRDACYCTADQHKITPNSKECEKYTPPTFKKD